MPACLGPTWKFKRTAIFVKIVYHAVDDRQGKISRSKVVVMCNTSNLRFQIIYCHDWSYDRSHDTTIDRAIGHRRQRSIDRRPPTIGRRQSRLIVHRSLIVTTSRTISYDGSCHRYSPIVRDSATTRRDQSRYAAAAGDRSTHCRSVAHWPNRNQSHDPVCLWLKIGLVYSIFDTIERVV